MKFLIVMLLISSQAMALSPWLENLNDPLKQQQIDLRWSAYGGEVDIQFYYDFLSTIEIEVNGGIGDPKKAWKQQNHFMEIKSLGGLDLQVPYGILENITDGALSLEGQLSFTYAGKVHVFSPITIVPAKNKERPGDIAVLHVLDNKNNAIFELTHIHASINHEKKQLLLKNIDVTALQAFAIQLDAPQIAGKVIAQMHISTDLNVPSGGITSPEYIRGATCADRPRWSSNVDPNGLDVDVLLIDAQAQFTRELSGNRVIFTPRAVLKNSGINNADVPWHRKFSVNRPPHNNDQHPFLNWAMYREVDGRFEQLGRSGIKHAFFTVNQRCDLNCFDGQILWPGCEDTYGYGTNDSNSTLGPREEVNAFFGLWESTGSVFDPDADGDEDTLPPSDERERMIIDGAKINDPNNDYYISSWYTIRDDVNIFNTMGYRSYDPVDNNNNTWSLNNEGTFMQGPASDAYVAPNTLDEINMEASTRIVTSEGHLTVAVKIFDEGNGTYRYNYMIENFDFDPTLRQYNINLPNNNSFSKFVFADIDSDNANDWQATHTNDVLSLVAPAGNEQHWGKIFSFSFTTDATPVVGSLELEGVSVDNASITADSILVPATSDLIFENGFE